MARSRAVALIDDDLTVLESLKFLLEVNGYTVAGYSAAAAFLEDQRADIACVVTDQHMPGMTGLELAARMLEEGRMLPFLLVTGLPTPDIVAHAAQLGITLIEKSHSKDEVLAFIALHLEDSLPIQRG